MFQPRVRDRIGWLARRTGRHTDRRGLIRLRPGLEGLEVRAVPALGGLNLQTVAGGLTPNGIGFWPNAVAVGDFNGDGRLDIAATRHDSAMFVFHNNGDGTFTRSDGGFVGTNLTAIAV